MSMAYKQIILGVSGAVIAGAVVLFVLTGANFGLSGYPEAVTVLLPSMVIIGMLIGKVLAFKDIAGCLLMTGSSLVWLISFLIAATISIPITPGSSRFNFDWLGWVLLFSIIQILVALTIIVVVIAVVRVKRRL